MSEPCTRLIFAHKLTILLNTFDNLNLLYNQDIQVVNFSYIELNFVNVFINYITPEERSVKLEALGNIGPNYELTLEFIW